MDKWSEAIAAPTGLFGRGHFIVLNEAPSSPKVIEMRERMLELQSANEDILAQSETAEAELTDEQSDEIEANAKEIESLSRRVKAQEAIARTAIVTTTRRTQETNSGAENRRETGQNPGRRTVPADARSNSGLYGFRTGGEFFALVKRAGGGSPDESARTQLHNALTTYGNEGTGADGGYMVPPDFRRDIMVKVMGEDSLLAMTDQQTTQSNSITFPMDETTPWQTTGGIQVYWDAEAQQKQQSKPLIGQETVRLNKLIALVPVTDELLEDAPAMDGYLRRKVPDKMTAKLNNAIIAGTGVGQPKGIMTSGALVVVAAEGGQTADTVNFQNIVKMYSAMYAGALTNAVWLINQNTLPQLINMVFVGGAATPVPVWLPQNSAAGQRWSTLFGRPVIPVQAMPTLGDSGDILLADMSQYLTVTKGQAIRTDVSIHVFFDYDVTAFRFVMRVGGQPWFDAPIVPQRGSQNLGMFVALADRP